MQFGNKVPKAHYSTLHWWFSYIDAIECFKGNFLIQTVLSENTHLLIYKGEGPEPGVVTTYSQNSGRPCWSRVPLSKAMCFLYYSSIKWHLWINTISFKCWKPHTVCTRTWRWQHWEDLGKSRSTNGQGGHTESSPWPFYYQLCYYINVNTDWRDTSQLPHTQISPNRTCSSAMVWRSSSSYLVPFKLT